MLFSGIGFFLSLWIVIPAPTFFLLPLGVGAPEISPWLILLNAIAFVLTISQLKIGVLYDVALIASFLGLLLSWLPLIQLPAANAQFAQGTHPSFGNRLFKSNSLLFTDTDAL